MKARIKATGEIVNVYNWGDPTFRADNGNIYQRPELDFDIEDENNPDYWEKLKHQYAGMAMQGLATRGEVLGATKQEIAIEIADISNIIAHALVEKLKEKEERK